MPTTADSDRATRLQKRIRKYSGEWLTFLDHPGVAPTNNLAEQALRAVVILRKLTFGSRTKAGAKRLGTMMTVIETAKRQGQNVLKFLGTLLTMDTNQARARCTRGSDRHSMQRTAPRHGGNQQPVATSAGGSPSSPPYFRTMVYSRASSDHLLFAASIPLSGLDHRSLLR